MMYTDFVTKFFISNELPSFYCACKLFVDKHKKVICVTPDYLIIYPRNFPSKDIHMSRFAQWANIFATMVTMYTVCLLRTNCTSFHNLTTKNIKKKKLAEVTT